MAVPPMVLPPQARPGLWPAGSFVLLLACAGCRESPAATTRDLRLDEAAAAITPEAVGAHVAWLAADERLGRGTPGPALAASADYVAAVLRAAGLQPGGDGGSFLQRFACSGLSGDERPANVVAYRRGSDARLASQWIVLTAHYDGLGVRRPAAGGDSIYNGAEDDASGTAALLEVARAVSGLARAPARSVAFVAMGGEELGLVGSWWFVEHPPTGMQEIVGNVNLDMVGRNAPAQLYAFGEAWSSVGAAARAVNTAHPELRFNLIALTNEGRGFERSDHFPFAYTGTPAIFLGTGLDAEYHTPADEVSLIDNEKLSRVARLTLYLVHDLADRAPRPTWNDSWSAARAGFNPIRGSCSQR